jgi:hypothetical protein
MMKARNIENGLALVGAVVVLIGVSFAADNAAEKANAETAAAAAASLALENWIELDIQLEDRTSTLIARGK